MTKNYGNMQRSQQLQRKQKFIILTNLTVNMEILKKIYNNLEKNVVYKLNYKILRRLIDRARHFQNSNFIGYQYVFKYRYNLLHKTELPFWRTQIVYMSFGQLFLEMISKNKYAHV